MHSFFNPIINRMLSIAAAVAGVLAVSSVQAAITYSGDIRPASNPASWNETPTVSYIAYSADAMLNIAGGSTVSQTNSYIGTQTGATGTITVDGVGSAFDVLGRFELGNYGTGILNITNGGTVSNRKSTMSIGYNVGGVGIITVDGPGSAITGGNYIDIGGYFGYGRLTVTNGGSVSNANTAIGYGQGGVGSAVIDGVGSSWTMSSTLRVGHPNRGTRIGQLSISDGGAVSTNAVSINAVSTLTTDVGRGSSLTVAGGTGTVTNDGTIRLVAGADAASGDYTPIAYGMLTGTGIVQALGGVWDGDAHTVTVSDAATAQAGEVATLDLSTTQRLLVTDSASGDSVGLGFQGTDIPTSLSFSASPAETAQQAALQSLLAPGETVLSAWDVTPGEGYASGDPAYLSLGIGSGLKLTDLAIWHFDGGLWSLFSAHDLAYDNQHASFTATGFSSYAVTAPVASFTATGFSSYTVTAPVPVPAAVWLFGSALAGMGMFGRSKAA